MANIEQIFGAGNAAMSETKLAKICSNVENKSILVSQNEMTLFS